MVVVVVVGEIQLSHFENASLVRPVIMNVQT